jgi:hypothetical protein
VGCVLDLITPCNPGLEAIVDNRNADALRGVETANVAIHICAADAQGFVSRIQAAAMDKNHDGPIAAVRKKEVEAMFRIGW